MTRFAVTYLYTHLYSSELSHQNTIVLFDTFDLLSQKQKQQKKNRIKNNHMQQLPQLIYCTTFDILYFNLLQMNLNNAKVYSSH